MQGNSDRFTNWGKRNRRWRRRLRKRGVGVGVCDIYVFVWSRYKVVQGKWHLGVASARPVHYEATYANIKIASASPEFEQEGCPRLYSVKHKHYIISTIKGKCETYGIIGLLNPEFLNYGLFHLDKLDYNMFFINVFFLMLQTSCSFRMF